MFSGLGAVPDTSNPTDPCYKLSVLFGSETIKIPVYFSQPESIFQKKIFPFITIFRDPIELAMHRWMGVGQLEYRAGVPGTQVILSSGVSGFSEYQMKPQAFPYDITYTISIWDRYERTALTILKEVLKAYQPVGRLIVYDSLALRRSYEYYVEGAITNLQEVIDPVTRARGYAITIRVEAELDLNEPYTSGSVSGVTLGIYPDY
jgi:hypothetical protein